MTDKPDNRRCRHLIGWMVATLGLIQVLVWSIDRAQDRNQGAPPTQVPEPTTPQGATAAEDAPTHADKPPSEAYLKEFSEAIAVRRQALRDRVIATFAIALFTVFGLELTANLQRLQASESLFSANLYFATISRTDATVIVIGLLTVVAALNIAVASWRPLPSALPAEDFANGFVWAEQIRTIGSLSATAAFATAMPQIPSMGEEGIATTVFLLGLGAAAVWLSAGTPDWKSHEPPTKYQEERGIANLKHEIAVWREDLSTDVWTRRKALARGAVFVVVIALVGSGVTVGVARAVNIQTDLAHAGFYFCVIAGILIYFMPLLIWLTIREWVSVGQLPEDRGAARIFRWCQVIFTAAAIALPFSTIEDLPSIFWLLAGIIELFGVVVPLGLLSIARKRQKGPGIFALHLRIIQADKTLQGMKPKEQRPRLHRSQHAKPSKASL